MASEAVNGEARAEATIGDQAGGKKTVGGVRSRLSVMLKGNENRWPRALSAAAADICCQHHHDNAVTQVATLGDAQHAPVIASARIAARYRGILLNAVWYSGADVLVVSLSDRAC